MKRTIERVNTVFATEFPLQEYSNLKASEDTSKESELIDEVLGNIDFQLAVEAQEIDTKSFIGKLSSLVGKYEGQIDPTRYHYIIWTRGAEWAIDYGYHRFHVMEMFVEVRDEEAQLLECERWQEFNEGLLLGSDWFAASRDATALYRNGQSVWRDNQFRDPSGVMIASSRTELKGFDVGMTIGMTWEKPRKIENPWIQTQTGFGSRVPYDKLRFISNRQVS